ncbi:LuxR C-terminal-related transcriptional regulator [Streptomyces sp. NPDC102365]|uniref:helix-turn-helix transcriptional regulator n=1 Tax=Streptomyces sp. NPDC102365 TaxID=3366162 RepID=UPI00381E7801
MHPAEAIRGFLDALGVPAQRIPVELDGQSALYRSLLANRRMLVVLDNAQDADQVRPLLPGSPDCFSVVTSRNLLIGLMITHGAQPLGLGLMSHAESEGVLDRRIIAFFTGAHREYAAQVFPELTEREREVLDLVALGHGNHQIAGRLVLSEKTVRNHVSAILFKLQVSDRAAAVARARDAGMGRSPSG